MIRYLNNYKTPNTSMIMLVKNMEAIQAQNDHNTNTLQTTHEYIG
jgi:hypothetical protein